MSGPATPYPSDIVVSGVGAVTDVNVTLVGFSHAFPDDVDLLLVGPDGTRLVLLSDAGSLTDAVNLLLTVDDQAAGLFPDGGPLVSGSFQPTNIGAGDVFPAPAPATGTLATTLAAYNGRSANGTWSLYFADDAGGDAGAFEGGWSLNFNNTTPAPTFAVSPASTQDFGTSGPCLAATTRQFTVTNIGTGTLQVTGASVTGSTAFSVTSSLPVSLAAGETTTITVLFQSDVVQTGSQSATLSIAYNDGTAQTANIALTGTADNTSTLAAGQGGGFLFNGSQTGVCAGSNPAPAGTGFIDIAGHTRIVTWTNDGATGGDDSFFTLAGTALDALVGGGQVRFPGRNLESLFINSNGYIGFGTVTGSVITALPTSTGGGVAAAFAQDLDVTTATYDAADPGLYPVGVYYGSADVDGNGQADLIVTWFHAYAFGSPAYTDPAARYATFQLVLLRGDRANEDDLFEVRLIDGRGSYVTTTTLGDVITAWQGMFIQNNNATSIAIPATAKTTGGTFVGRTDDTPFVAFELAGTTPAGAQTVDLAAVLAFGDDASAGWDLLDASKLTPVTAAYATAAFVGEREGEAQLQAQFSLPTTASVATVIPVAIEAVGTQPTLTLSWPTFQNVPDAWGFSLRDLVTGAVVDLRTATGYTFDVAPTAARTGSPATWLAETTTGSVAGARTAPRFEIVVTTGNVVAGEGDTPAEFAMEAARPNPTAGQATVRFAMPDAGAVSVAVYDLLGRQVATLVEGDLAAGWHTASLDASRLSAGMYVVRMNAGTFAATQRVTVVR